MTDPWAFGWTQLLTIVGFLITLGIALGGFRTFGRWKREKVEERRIEIAFEALSLAHESKAVFGRIRDPNGYEGEWRTMEKREGENESDRAMRGGSFAIIMRLKADSDFFDRVARVQPKAMAVFGPSAEVAFDRLDRARIWVQDAAIQLTWRLPVHPSVKSEEDFAMRMGLRADLWAGFGNNDRVEKELVNFRTEVEAIFRPVVAKWLER